MNDATAPTDPARLLALTGVVTAPAITAALRAFAPAPGSRGLDVGCGIGSQTLLLADAVGPQGRVTGLDASPDMLARAHAAAVAEAEGAAGGVAGPSGGSDRRGGGSGAPCRSAAASRAPIEFLQGDLAALPVADASFDWLWCADTLWPGMVVDDPAPAARELARVLRPSGQLALLYWSGQRLLPGHPALEARLDEAFAAAVPYMSAAPERHFSRAVGWLRAAGLRNVAARTFVADHQAPLDPRTREALAACLTMLWGGLQDRLDPADRDEFRRLCGPDSPDLILLDPGYAAAVSYTMFTAEVPPPRSSVTV